YRVLYPFGELKVNSPIVPVPYKYQWSSAVHTLVWFEHLTDPGRLYETSEVLIVYNYEKTWQ
ncbi:Hypothetical predicted protein, partial [Pelobates cultripes]